LTRLLVADDSETVLLMLQRRLEMEGYDVVTATDGLEALEALRNSASQEPDVILLDAMMPNKSGTEVLEEIRGKGSEVPIVMISAHLDAQEPDRMRTLGASDCIPKPFEWDDLIGKIEELAGNADGDSGSDSNSDSSPV
jgi:two-component system response regulator MprA